MAVRIRLKMMGRKHRPFFRLCAVDARKPRDGRVLEELGIYDPMVPDTDARAILKGDRIDYWLGVGAIPSPKAQVLIKKYGTNGTNLEAQEAALAKLKNKPRYVASAEKAVISMTAPAPEEAAPAAAEGDAPAAEGEAPAAEPEAPAEAAE
ncbi:MAG: 30S ribosomal protein S16 [Thermoguttaceae bacterium]|nr:30S ribosomal protein S16 [Thermoguttaceae bacterium]